MPQKIVCNSNFPLCLKKCLISGQKKWAVYILNNASQYFWKFYHLLFFKNFSEYISLAKEDLHDEDMADFSIFATNHLSTKAQPHCS